MKTLQVIVFNLFFSFGLVVTGYSQTIIFNNEVQGIWSKANSPYIVLRNINVPSDSLLVIEHGVEVQFVAGFGMKVYGNLLAVGDDNDKIIFTSADTTSVKSDSTLGWNGITILGENTDTSIIENCVVEYVYANQDIYDIVEAKSAINIQNRYVFINKCIIKKNIGYYGGGIYCDDEANVLILNSIISNNSGAKDGTPGGIYIQHSNAIIMNNLISNNEIGIIIKNTNENSDTVKVLNNTIVQNVPYHSYLPYNNIYVSWAKTIFRNCIIWNNPVVNNDDLISINQSDYAEFENCIIPGGKTAFDLVNGNNVILNNVYDINPFFVDYENENFQLTDSSYGINGGKNYSLDILAYVPYDLIGNPRIYNDDDDIIDVGAYEFQGISINRPPVINNPGTKHVLTSTSREMIFSFSDVDANDSHVLSVSSSNPNVTISALSAQTNNATYTIDPVAGWTGEADIVLSVTDNAGAQDIDTFKFAVSDSVNYNIDENTVWDADTVYIAGDIAVSSGATLEIREGTCVQFKDNYYLVVYGTLRALGTAGNKIRFTSSDTSGYSRQIHTGWSGIGLYNPHESSLFDNCIFEYVKENNVLRISGSATVDIVNCIFKNNISKITSPRVIEAKGSSYVFVGNCLFFDNTCARIIYTYMTEIKMYNNTFCNNTVKYGIVNLSMGGDGIIKNSIFYNNHLQDDKYIDIDISYTNDIEITNCIIQNGESSIYYTGSNIIKKDIFDVYPQFVDSLNRDYRLLSNSLAINNGIEDAQFIKLNIDLDGNNRIYDGTPVTDIPDIGAYEYQGDPVNRSPVLEMVEDRTAMLENPINVSVNFFDPDENDTHTITVLSDNANVDVQNLSGDTTGSMYTLVPAPGFNDTALISVIVEDNGGLKDSIGYNLIVNPCACGSIYEDMVWNDDTIYINCDVIVEEEATLTINPGVKVIFNGPYAIDIYGVLKAIGAENDTIVFTLNDTITFNDTIFTNAWRGIKINSQLEQDTSEIKYCEIMHSQEGGIEVNSTSNIYVSFCNIHHNLATDNKDGGGIYMNADKSLIENNFIHHNRSADQGGGIFSSYGSRITNNNISYNDARFGAGIYTISYSDKGSIIENNTIEYNKTTYSSGGGIYSRANDTIRNNTIRNNYSYSSGAGIHGYQHGVIINNIIEGNYCNDESSTYGGGLYLYSGHFTIANNLITKNYASTGGAGVYLSGARGILANNTICKNTTDNKGNALYLSGNISPEIINNIIWGNSSSGSISQIHVNEELLQPGINHCIIGGGKDSISYPTSLYYLKEYNNNIDKDPYFVDFTNDDYNLTDSSICINSGVADTSGLIPDVDITGNDRIFNGTVDRIDIGAYEFIGEPANRPPYISSVEDIVLFSSQTKQMKVEYIDPDDSDTHTLTIESSDPDFSVENISGDTINSTYDIVGTIDWQGNATIKIRVEDDGGLADSIYYTVIVNDTLCGDISERTVWDKDTIVISCNVIVPEDKTLTILPGTVVLFTSGNSISVYGTIKAEGTAEDSIHFIIKDTSGIYDHWGGIDFYRNSAEETSKLTHCDINYSYNFRIESGKVAVSNCNFDHCLGSNGGALYILNSSPLIENCVFTNNSAWNTGGAISCIDEDYSDVYKTNPIIRGNEFYFNEANYGGAIYCRESDAEITENSIHNNNAGYYGGAVYLRECDNPVLYNDVMYKNSTSNGGAIYSYNTHGYYINNTIIKNKSTRGGAFHITKYSHPQIYNSIIYYNEATYSGNQIYLADDNSDPSFYNCFIQYGLDSMQGDGASHEYDGDFKNILSVDPLFADTTNNNYQLSDSSFCINAGAINIKDRQLPAQDIAGNSRVYAGELSNVDVGAYEFQGNPINRRPCIVSTKDQYTSISQRKKLSVHFTDVDKSDVHTITITTNNVSVTVENISGDVSGSTYELVPANEWEGIAEIYVRVEDDKGKYDIDTFNLIVSEYYCGSITENTVWDADTIKVACDVIVEENASLIILPGTVVRFDDYAQLKVFGRLLAVGTKENRVVFTSSDISSYPDESYAGWKGIRFYGPGSADTSSLVYCTIQYAKGVDQNYTGDEYGGGLFFDGWNIALVSNCLIHNNSAIERGGGIYCSSSHVLFENNIISNNDAEYRGGGICTNRGNIIPTTDYLINNIICNNYALSGGGIYCNGLHCYNNIIANNEANVGGGLFIDDNSVEVVNSVLWGNVATASFTASDQISISWSDNLNLYHNVIEGGLNGIDSEGAITNNEDLIEQDPEFISPSSGAGIDYNGLTANWALSAISPCIDNGTQGYTTYNFEYPEYDIIGNNRVLMDTIDIGAYEFRNYAPEKTGGVPNQQIYAESACDIHIPVNGVFTDNNIGDILSYSVSAINPPAWMNIDIISDNINITGTPGENYIGITEAVLFATDLFGAEIADTFNIEVLEATAISSEPTEEIRLYQIYPNPANSNITIESQILSSASIELYNLNGMKVLQQKITANKQIINISAYPVGMYTYKIFSNTNQFEYGKLIINR